MKEIFQDDDSNTELDFKINTNFADKYLKSKKSEEVSSLKRKYSQVSEEESSEEEEDDIGDLLTPELDSQIENTINLLRKKDPVIYKEDQTFFSEDVEIKTDRKAEKPFRIKDYHRRELLNGPSDQSPQELTIVEQDKLLSQEVKKAFKEAVEEDDQDLLTLKPSKSPKTLKSLKKVDQSPKTEVELDQGEKFLMDYLNKKKWMENEEVEGIKLIEMSDDERGIEATESFEAKYNFRFEEQGGESLISHSRNVTSLRRSDEKRKRMREKKNSRKETEKIKKEEELKRLKNLKKEEIMERLKKIEKISGTNAGDLEGFLSRDFDPNDFDKHMEEKFGQEYYNQKDGDYKKVDLKKDLQDYSQDLELDTENVPLLKENIEKKKQSLLDDLYALDYEDLIGDLPVRFKYRSVEANNYGINAKDILRAEDKELNEFLSLKKMAPFRPAEKVKKDKKSWYKHGKSKILELKSNLKKRKKEVSGQQMETDSRLSSYNL